MIAFQDQVATDFARGIVKWKRRRQIKAAFVASAAAIMLIGGWLTFVMGPITDDRGGQVVTDRTPIAPTVGPIQDPIDDPGEIDLATEPAQLPSVVNPNVGAGDTTTEPRTPAASTDGRGERFANGVPPAGPSTDDGQGGDAADLSSEPNADGQAEGVGASDGLADEEGSGENDEGFERSETIDFDIVSATVEGDEAQIEAIVELSHERACLEASFESGDTALSYRIDVFERDCDLPAETTWGRLTLGAIDPGVHELRLNDTRWPFVVEESREDDPDPSLPSGEAVEVVLDDIVIEYAKYRDDWQREQANPGSWIDTVVTVRALVPNDCYALVVDIGDELHVATVTAEPLGPDCVGIAGEVERTLEFVLPHPTGELGSWTATINGVEIPFDIGRSSLESVGSSPFWVQRDPAGTRLVTTSPGDYALVWERYDDPCTEYTLMPDPNAAATYVSMRYTSPLPPVEPGTPQLGCGPGFDHVSVGLGSGQLEDLKSVVLNGQTFAPYELRINPTFVAGEPGAPGVIPAPTEMSVVDSRTGVSLGSLNDDWGLGWVQGQPVQLRLESLARDSCTWRGEVNIGDSPGAVAISLSETCEGEVPDRFVTVALDDIDIEYAKYRDDWERNQANPGSFLDTIVTVRALVPNDCYELVARTGVELHTAVVLAERVVEDCVSITEVERTLEFVLPHPSNERGPWVATINDVKIPFNIGDYSLEKFVSTVGWRIERDPDAFELVAVTPGDYALVWTQIAEGCSTHRFAPDPERPGAYISEWYKRPTQPSPPGFGPAGCDVGPRFVAVGLGSDRAEDLEPVTINGETSTPIPIRFEPQGSELGVEPPENLPPPTEISLRTPFRNLGYLDADWGFAWVQGGASTRIELWAPTNDPLCNWSGFVDIDGSEDVVPVAFDITCF